MVDLRYERKGQCNRCGICCLTEGKNGEPCKYLKWDGNKAECMLFNHPERPEKCKTFPQAPPILIDECGYYFIDLWEDGRVVKAREV